MNEIIKTDYEKLDFTYEYAAFSSGEEYSHTGSGRDYKKTSNILNEGVSEESSDEYDFIYNVNFEGEVNENHKLDYLVAAGSGLLTGVLDLFFAKDINLEEAANWGTEEVNELVIMAANRFTKYDGDDLKKAIEALEDKFPLATDKLMAEFGGGRQHHLRDYAHHASPIGLFFSILSQLTGKGFGTIKNEDGSFGFGVIPFDDKAEELRGKNLHEKLFFGVVRWAGHLISDMAGSSSNPGKGAGIPGPILSCLKMLSELPVVKELKLEYGEKEIPFSVWVSKLYNGTYFKNNGNPIKFDLRAEIGLGEEFAVKYGIQTAMVILNEVIVRAFYFFRTLYLEIVTKDIKSIKDIERIDALNVLPFNSRKLARMCTISSGVFLATNLTGAAIKACKCDEDDNRNGKKIKFDVSTFVLSLNFPGIGRFAIACKADSKYIIEDINTIYTNFQNKHCKSKMDDSEDIPGFKMLVLNSNQTRILMSLKYHGFVYDVMSTKKEADRMNKMKWIEEWKKKRIMDYGEEGYFIEEQNELYREIHSELAENRSTGWLYMIILEMHLTQMYCPLTEIAEENKDYKGLKCCSDYLKDVFANTEEIMPYKEIKNVKKVYDKYMSILTNGKAKKIAGTALVLAVAGGTGGAALAFAPQIAVILAGGSYVGLSGAALTSASLAAIGGGSLAAGGLGMAGGTAIITGGGSLLGLMSAGSASVVSSAIFRTKDVVLSECAKLLTISKIVMYDLENNKALIESIIKFIENSKIKLYMHSKSMESYLALSKAEQKKIDNERVNLIGNLKHIEKTNEELRKIVGE